MGLNTQNVNLKMTAGFASQFPTDPIPQVALSGRSNVGKSSLINTLLGRKSLARVSATPGKTITVNFYEVDKKLFLKLPVKLVYPFIKFGAKLYGQFDLEETSPIELIKNCKVPVIFYHGEDDDFVPCFMSKENCDVCPSRKALVTVPGAGHGLSFPMDEERYIRTLREFFGPELSYDKTPVA